MSTLRSLKPCAVSWFVVHHDLIRWLHFDQVILLNRKLIALGPTSETSLPGQDEKDLRLSSYKWRCSWMIFRNFSKGCGTFTSCNALLQPMSLGLLLELSAALSFLRGMLLMGMLSLMRFCPGPVLHFRLISLSVFITSTFWPDYYHLHHGHPIIKSDTAIGTLFFLPSSRWSWLKSIAPSDPFIFFGNILAVQDTYMDQHRSRNSCVSIIILFFARLLSHSFDPLLARCWACWSAYHYLLMILWPWSRWQPCSVEPSDSMLSLDYTGSNGLPLCQQFRNLPLCCPLG